MKDIRQGNDIKVSWSIFKKGGQIFSLEGKKISLYLKSVFGRKELNDFVITGNIIQWTFYGKDQKSTGKYSLELVVNEGEKGMITTDTCDFVNLVSCSCKLQGGEDAPNVETESIELTSTLEYVSGGGAYDDTAIWKELENKVDKVEGKGLSSNDFTNALKEKLEGLENYDDAEISSAVEKLSRDFNALLGNNASAAIESFNEIIAFLEGIEDSASLDAIVASIQQEIAKVSNGLADTDAKLTELSAEVSGLSEKVDALGEGGAQEILKVEYGKTTFQEIKDAFVAGKYIVFEYANNVFHINRVTDTEIYFVSINGTLGYRVGLNNKNNWYQNVYQNEQSTNKVTSLSSSSTDTQYPSAKAVYDALQNVGGASNEWKCVYDGRMEEGKSSIIYTTYADGTPLKAREAIIEVVNDIKAAADITGYVRIQSTLNKNKCSFGIITYESASVGDGKIMVQDVRIETSEHFFTKAYIAKDMKNAIAHSSVVGEEIGHNPQIFEDIVSIELASNLLFTEAAPLVKIYAR